ncbi:hypothetical protein Hanom_Chr11g00997021 [Helianthus anomalus]
MIYTYRPVFIHITTHSRIKVCTRVHLTGENLIFICMRAQEQVREQVSTFVQQRDELDSRINVIFYHLFCLDM